MGTLRFKDLKLYECFEFADVILRNGLYVAAGPWRKVSARCYEHVTLGMRSQVGTVNVQVERSDYDPLTSDGFAATAGV